MAPASRHSLHPRQTRSNNMYICPHCQQAGISYFNKWWSCSSKPATCTFCGELSYVTALVSNSIFSVGILTLVATLTFAFTEKSKLVAIAGLIATIVCYAYLWHIAPLHPTSAKQSASATSFSWGMLLIIGITALLK